MLKIKVTEKSGASIEYQSLVELDYSALGHGLHYTESRSPAYDQRLT